MPSSVYCFVLDTAPPDLYPYLHTLPLHDALPSFGGAVVRNPMKRRFRALSRTLLPALGVKGADHVLIGRAGGVERDFALLEKELAKADRKSTRLNSSH